MSKQATQLRIIYGDGEHLNGVDSVRRNPGKVFAVIGPFDNHMDKDKQVLMDALEDVCRRFNQGTLGQSHMPRSGDRTRARLRRAMKKRWLRLLPQVACPF